MEGFEELFDPVLPLEIRRSSAIQERVNEHLRELANESSSSTTQPPQASISHVCRPVSIFIDFESSAQLQKEERINKELIVNFLFKELEVPILTKTARVESTLLKWRTAYQSMMYPVLSKESDLDFLPILIDESCFYKGNKKVPQQIPQTNYIKVYAQLEDDQGRKQELCPKCTKKYDKIVLVRKVELTGKKTQTILRLPQSSLLSLSSDVLIKASVTCSGNPLNANRILVVRFTFVLVENNGNPKEYILFEGLSTPFTLLHHRGKRELIQSQKAFSKKKEKIKKKREDPILSNYKSLVPNYKLSDKILETLLPLTKELLPHLTEAVLADSFGNLFDDSLFHFAIQYLNTYFSNRLNLYDAKAILPLAEFIFSASGFHDATANSLDPSFTQKIIQRYSFFYPKAASIAPKLNGISSSLQTQELVIGDFWECAATVQVFFSKLICPCNDCNYSHLAFIIDYALSNGVKRIEIVEELTRLGIPTRQNKTWHTSMNGITEKTGHCNLLHFLSATPIGAFSRNYIGIVKLKQRISEMNDSMWNLIVSSPLGDSISISYGPFLTKIPAFISGLLSFIESIGNDLGVK